MSSATLNVAIAGIAGKMGTTLADAVSKADDLNLVCGVDKVLGNATVPVYPTVDEALAQQSFDVLVDFTRADAAEENLRSALSRGVNCVLGTTGLSTETLQSLMEHATGDPCLFFAPNFTIGAVLLMAFARQCATYFPDAEIIELHHGSKADAPSGTAINTAHAIASHRHEASKAPGKESELPDAQGARGALVDGVPVHSVRTDGYVASQEVIFGSFGQTLTLRHDSWDRASYMPGVLLAIRSVSQHSGLIIGLDKLLEETPS